LRFRLAGLSDSVADGVERSGRRYPPILAADREPIRSNRCTHLLASAKPAD